MSGYTPTTDEVRRQWGDAVDYYRSPQQRLPGFDRWLAEYTREKQAEAWDRCVGEMPIDPDWKNFYGDNNPYRKEENNE